MKGLMQRFKQITKYPSAMLGLVILVAFVGVSIYTVIAIPYREAIRLWRGGEAVWYQNPKTARPEWFNLFRQDKLSSTIVVNSQDDTVTKSTDVVSEDMTDITFSLPFDFQADGFPQEIIVFFTTKYIEKTPFVSLTWLTPDGREIRLGNHSAERSLNYRISQDSKLPRKLRGLLPHVGLFADPSSSAEEPVVLKGTYTLQVRGSVFEDEADVDAELVVFGQVHGWAGTDHLRRDLSVALLYGAPVALSFGLLAAFGTSLTTMVIAGIGTWFGGVLDEVIQRITQVRMILPLLPLLVMIGTFYSRSIWLMLGVVIIMNIFGGAILTYRAMFLQVKQSPYIEAARAYGASNLRIIFSYLVPRIIPTLIPRLVVLVPAFVFLEAALAVLGLGDPVLPTWGKIINDARTNGALFEGLYYWVLEPSILLMLTGFAFSMVGFSLDRIFNPRLRGL